MNSAGRAFGRLVRAHQVLLRELEAQLTDEHQLSVSEFDVLLLLSKAEDQSMRRVDLAKEMRLSPSGITRMLDRLEAAGVVEKCACADDARVSYAVLTDKGRKHLMAAMPRHFDALQELMGARLSGEEIEQLADLLERLAGGIEDEPCQVGTPDAGA